MSYISYYRPFRYWGKAGLEIKSGRKRVTVTVPRAWQDRLSVVWGDVSGAEGVSSVQFPNCTFDPGIPWKAYAGGFFARERMCAPLIVRVAGRERWVLVALGRSCPR